MDFSVIIGTRNRPVLVRRALNSVLEQQHPSMEFVLVNDGSDPAHAAAYAAIREEFASRGQFIDLRRTPRGHGQSYAYNRGAEVASGQYFCFLDDDDFWTDPGHLARAHSALTRPGRAAETYFANQKAFIGDAPVERALWLESLESLIHGKLRPDPEGIYEVGIEDLMRCEGFGHVNVSIVHRDLYARIGGFDENIRYENDRDFYHRNVDNSRGILYCPRIVSRHTVPDPTRSDTLSTSISPFERLVTRAQVWNKARTACRSPAIRRVARLGKGSTLRQIALELEKRGDPEEAFHYGLEGLAARFSLPWSAYCAWLGVKSLFGIGRRAGS